MSGILSRGIVYVVGALGAVVFFWASLISLVATLFFDKDFIWALPILMVVFGIIAIVGFVLSAKRMVREVNRPTWDF